MNSKRKADLQRKLSLAPVARPPAGLADRLKQDIPTNLTMTAEVERQRFSSSIGSNLRVAASILFMISGLYLTLHLLMGGAGSGGRQMMAGASMPPARRAFQRVAVTPASAPVTASQPMVFALAETTVVARADRSALQVPAKPSPTMPSPAAPLQKDELRQTSLADAIAQPLHESLDAQALPRQAALDREKTSLDAAPVNVLAEAPNGATTGATTGAMASEELRSPSAALAAPRPSAATAASRPVPMAPPPPPARMAESRAGAGTSVYGNTAMPDRDLVKAAKAADLSFAAPDSLFGISVDRRAFDRIKSAIEHGERPDATAVDVDALVNYFAGPPQRAPHEVRLEAEGSPAPVPGDPLRHIVRVTIDTAPAGVTTGGSTPPVAADAVLDVRFDPRAVATHRRIGGNELTSVWQGSLLKNASVTALYEIELLPSVQPRQPIATAQLTYRSVTDGREQKIVQTLQRRDLAHSWKAASRRHRLASLGAVWGETLKGNVGGQEIARRAEELAHQAPHDEKARELADVASASSHLHATAAAGSAR